MAEIFLDDLEYDQGILSETMAIWYDLRTGLKGYEKMPFFISILSGSTPLALEPWGSSNRMTAKALDSIGSIGGPRCCKRDSYLAILAAIDFVKEEFGIEMERPDIQCIHYEQNNQCIGGRCPFNPFRQKD